MSIEGSRERGPESGGELGEAGSGGSPIFDTTSTWEQKRYRVLPEDEGMMEPGEWYVADLPDGTHIALRMHDEGSMSAKSRDRLGSRHEGYPCVRVEEDAD